MTEELLHSVRKLIAAQAAVDMQRQETMAEYEKVFKQLPALKGYPIRVRSTADGDGFFLRVFNMPTLPEVGPSIRGAIGQRINTFEKDMDQLCGNAAPIILVSYVDTEDTKRYYPNVLEPVTKKET